ncbi:unnamed protein product, partial [Closterium sp. Naga37s-1]
MTFVFQWSPISAFPPSPLVGNVYCGSEAKVRAGGSGWDPLSPSRGSEGEGD